MFVLRSQSQSVLLPLAATTYSGAAIVMCKKYDHPTISVMVYAYISMQQGCMYKYKFCYLLQATFYH